MNRRVFLKRTTTAAGALAVVPVLAASEEGRQGPSVRDVHVIFKTHLDIGFTDLSANVIRTYFESFIPAALSLSETFRKEAREDRFIWTTGSWLIYQYLEQADSENRRRMERAIEAGDIVWHGLPFTTHTELIDDSLFMLGTALSARLDQRFGRTTIAAKMTDVPGHSRGIVPLMHEAGLRFLHIGVNPASTPPDVPPLFRWQTGGCELLVMYQRQYGSVMTLPGGRTAVAICFTGDNHGPQSPAQIARIYEDLRRRFPGAKVFASTLDAVARDVLQAKSELPVVTQELGDTWIHGPGSDPLRIAQFRELSRLRRRWLAQGRLAEHGPVDIAFGGKLLMVAEHTWGLDIKTHLKDWSLYSRDELAAAREKPNFQRTERSWAEKRAYVSEAVAALPTDLADQARASLRDLLPARRAHQDGDVVAPTALINTRHFTIGIDAKTGAISTLKDLATGRNWAGDGNPLAAFSYQTFSQADYDRFHDQYLTQRPAWALSDFGKPGMEADNPQARSWSARLREMRVNQDEAGHRIVLQLDVPRAGDTGCPRRLVNTLRLPSDERALYIDFVWHDKPAYRLPEAMWLSFCPMIDDENGYLLDKMGHSVSPLDVVRNGNRSLHGVIEGVKYADGTGGFALDTLDAFLIAPGRRSLLDFNNDQPAMKGGLHFCLCNNVWGTNFMMWFEDDMQFRFKLSFA